jgi:hypothetical protein
MYLCRAWREGFTITLVSGRTVGIGAYLARLGRRCVQRTDQPIILTGFQALNKVLGKEVRPWGYVFSVSLVVVVWLEPGCVYGAILGVEVEPSCVSSCFHAFQPWPR